VDNLSELLQPSGFEFYRSEAMPHEGAPLKRRDSPEALLKSLNTAHNNTRQLITENDHLRAGLLQLHKVQRRQLKIFLALMGLTWTTVGWVLKFLIPYAIHGMAK
jgi:hypothetical protein